MIKNEFVKDRKIITMKYLIIFLVSFTCFLSSCYNDNRVDLYANYDTACDITEASYLTHIVPIMEKQCYSCHSNTNAQGQINLEGYDNIKIYVNNGSLFGSMNHNAGYSIMPPSGQKASQCDLDRIKFWIDNGAADRKSVV